MDAFLWTCRRRVAEGRDAWKKSTPGEKVQVLFLVLLGTRYMKKEDGYFSYSEEEGVTGLGSGGKDQGEETLVLCLW